MPRRLAAIQAAPMMITPEQVLELLAEISPTPWSYNSYSAVFAGPQVAVDESFWTDERMNDGHTYDHRVGQICPACGERPACHPDGTRFGTYWDCEFFRDAYEADPVVASVPAAYGDTAVGRRIKDAELIAAAPDIAQTYLQLVERLHEIQEAHTAWESEGLGTCPEIQHTNYPDAWEDLGKIIRGEA